LIALYISLFLFWIFKYSEAIAEPYTPNKQDFTKLERLEPIPEPKPVNIPPKPKTLAREAKNDQSKGKFASTLEELSNIPQNQSSCFDYVPEMAKKYGVDGDLMIRIIKSESGGNPLAKNKNSTASGCSQWIRASWSGVLKQMGREWDTPFNAKLNVEAMAFKISRGGISAWDASKSKWNK
jgi:hypothetical protein